MRSEEEERGGGARRRNEEENKEDEETAGGNLCALGPSWSIPQSSVDPTAHPRPPLTDSTTMSDVPETWQGMRHAAQKKGH
mmetsp:Transcript_104542/g.291601  ORF Transcript_104542/g.291601 Transcript_104542/m.291601 type:complete len:81 (-) Transcript_104542:61-303(-)